MSKFVVLLMLSVLFSKMVFANDVKHSLPITDKFYQAESEVLAKGKIKVTDATTVLLQLIDEKNLTDKMAYIGLKIAGQYLIGYYSFRGQKTKEQLDEIIAFSQVLSKAVDSVLPQFISCPQILELLGDLNSYYILPNSGRNVALMLHYRAYNLGHKTDSVTINIVHDFVRMLRSAELQKQVVPNNDIFSNRNEYLFPLREKKVDARDLEKWTQLAMHYYYLVQEKESVDSTVIKNWLEKNKDFQFDQTLLQEGFIDIEEQAEKYETTLNDMAKSYQRIRENRQKSEAIAEKTRRKDEERKKEFEVATAGLVIFEKLPNTIPKMMQTLDSYSRFRGELREYKELPNYKKLKSLFSDSEEADVVNVFFLCSIKRYEDTLKIIETLNTKDKDTRLYYLKFYCLVKTKASDAVLEEYLDSWFKFAPNDPYATHTKATFENIRKKDLGDKE